MHSNVRLQRWRLHGLPVIGLSVVEVAEFCFLAPYIYFLLAEGKFQAIKNPALVNQGRVLKANQVIT